MPWRLRSASRCSILRRAHVDAAGRLVEHQRFRLGDERAPERRAAARRTGCGCAGRPGGRSPAAPARRAPRVWLPCCATGATIAPHLPHEHHLLHRHREVPVDGLQLRHRAHVRCGLVAQRLTVDRDIALIRLQCAQHQQSRLVLPAPLGPTAPQTARDAGAARHRPAPAPCHSGTRHCAILRVVP